MEAIEKRVVLKSKKAVERNVVLKKLWKKILQKMLLIEEMLKGCCCMWVHAKKDTFMRRGCTRFTVRRMWSYVIVIICSRGSKYDLHDTLLPADEVVGRGLELLVVLTAAKPPHLNIFKQNITKHELWKLCCVYPSRNLRFDIVFCYMELRIPC
jgi:hypothetical protein